RSGRACYSDPKLPPRRFGFVTKPSQATEWMQDDLNDAKPFHLGDGRGGELMQKNRKKKDKRCNQSENESEAPASGEWPQAGGDDGGHQADHKKPAKISTHRYS